MARFSQAFLQGLLQPTYQQGLFEAAKGLGQTPAIMGLQRQEREQKQKLADIYSTAMQPGTTSVQMFQAAQQLMAQGKTEEAISLLTQARQLSQTETSQLQLQQRQEVISESARKLGLNELAERALQTTDEESLRAIQKDLRAFEREEILKKRGIPGRKALLKNAGIDYDPEVHDEMSNDGILKLIEGSDAELKSFITPDNQEVMLEVNKQGRVRDPNTDTFVRASELQLRRAPNRQQVENVANYTNEKLAEAGVKRYDDLATAADDATKMMNNITEVMPNLDEMVTGKLANAEMFIRSSKQAIAAAVGLDPSDPKLENTEQFIALAAPRVATIIKDFGAGTGLSDADREFAKLGAGATQELTAANIRRMIELSNEKAEEAIGLHQRIYRTLEDEGAAPSSLAFYQAGPSLPSELSKYY